MLWEISATSQLKNARRNTATHDVTQTRAHAHNQNTHVGDDAQGKPEIDVMVGGQTRARAWKGPTRSRRPTTSHQQLSKHLTHAAGRSASTKRLLRARKERMIQREGACDNLRRTLVGCLCHCPRFARCKNVRGNLPDSRAASSNLVPTDARSPGLRAGAEERVGEEVHNEVRVFPSSWRRSPGERAGQPVGEPNDYLADQRPQLRITGVGRLMSSVSGLDICCVWLPKPSTR